MAEVGGPTQATQAKMPGNPGTSISGAVIGGLMAILILFWFAGAVAALVVNFHWVGWGTSSPPGIGLHMIMDPFHPATAWPLAERPWVPGPVPFYLVLVAVITFSYVGISHFYRRFGYWLRYLGGRRHWEGTPKDIRRYLSARGAARRIGFPTTDEPIKRMRINAGRALPEPVPGLYLGKSSSSRQPMWTSWEDSVYVLGPPRSGKTRALMAQGAAFPGPLVMTSNKADVARTTIGARMDRGRVWVFDPGDLLGMLRGVLPLRWSPIGDCVDTDIVFARAAGFGAASGLGGEGTTNGQFWENNTVRVVRCLLHAAALDGKGIDAVLEWLADPSTNEPLEILARSTVGTKTWVTDLSATFGPAAAERGGEAQASVLMGVTTALNCFSHPGVRRVTIPTDTGPAFDPEAFLRSEDTLYLLSREGIEDLLAPLVSAIIEDLVVRARRMASPLPRGRLPKPLGLYLDEVANLSPIRSLPKLFSTGGGIGVCPVAVFQSRAQANQVWGDGAEVIWASATAKLILPGHGSVDDLQDISTLAGQIDEETMSRSAGGVMGQQVSAQLRELPALPPDAIRSMARQGKWVQMLVLYQHLRPIRSQLPFWDSGPFRPLIARGQRRLAEIESGGPLPDFPAPDPPAPPAGPPADTGGAEDLAEGTHRGDSDARGMDDQDVLPSPQEAPTRRQEAPAPSQAADTADEAARQRHVVDLFAHAVEGIEFPGAGTDAGAPTQMSSFRELALQQRQAEAAGRAGPRI